MVTPGRGEEVPGLRESELGSHTRLGMMSD